MSEELKECYSGFDEVSTKRFNDPDLNNVILVEECAEVTQALCKIARFGLENVVTGNKNKLDLEEELGQLSVMIELVTSTYGLDKDNIIEAKNRKLVKMDKFY